MPITSARTLSASIFKPLAKLISLFNHSLWLSSEACGATVASFSASAIKLISASFFSLTSISRGIGRLLRSTSSPSQGFSSRSSWPSFSGVTFCTSGIASSIAAARCS